MKILKCKSVSYLILITISLVFNNCKQEVQPNELVGIWLAAAPYQDGIFYRPNLITDITPDKMTIYEDISNPTTFTWSQNGNTIHYENETQSNELQIIDYQLDTLIVALAKTDTLRFIRLHESRAAADEKLLSDASIFDLLFTQTFEINIPDLDWQIRKIDFLKGGKFVKYNPESLSTKSQTTEFELGTWELLVIRNHYFLFLNNLKSEKPLLIHLDKMETFKLSGQLAYAKDLYLINLQTVVNQNDLSEMTQELIIGKWQKPTYIFNEDATFLEIAAADTLNGHWKINATNDLIVLTKNQKTLQFGFIYPATKTIEMQYLSDFHNEFTASTINKINSKLQDK